MKNIVLVDDHVIIRNGLKELIEKIGPYKVVSEYDNGRDFVDSFPLAANIDLLVLDISMPRMDGDEVVEHMKAHGVTVPTLILTLNTDDEKLVRLFRNGVRGYLQKNCTAAVLKQALSDIFERGYFHNEHMIQALTADSSATGPKGKFDPAALFTERELQLIKLICAEEEYTYKEIAEKLSVHPRTVDDHRQNIFEKANVKSKSGLVLYAVRNGLID
ncbi:MAG: response regulator transcription factor [Taibaiella sp.]|nr:response regulator transcription factor [Taibaiella sp.]